MRHEVGNIEEDNNINIAIRGYCSHGYSLKEKIAVSCIRKHGECSERQLVSDRHMHL